MTYDEATNYTATSSEAIREYQRHGLTEADLISDLGEHAEYSGRAILRALGY